MRTSGDCKIGNPQNNLTGDCLIANWTPCTRTTKAHSFLLLAYQLKISWLSKDDNYVLERASTMSYASGVTPTPILSASASACLTWAKPWKSVRISESLCGFQDKIKLGPKQHLWNPRSSSEALLLAMSMTFNVIHNFESSLRQGFRV